MSVSQKAADTVQALTSYGTAALTLTEGMLPKAAVGAPNGVAPLDVNGKILPANIPANLTGVSSINGKSGVVTLAATDVNAVPSASVGIANGVAGLDSSGKIPAAQLPSFVDDVLEYSTLSAFPSTGETSKIYVADDSNKTYRWSGSTYIEISPSPGSTDAVAEGSVHLYFTNARAAAAAPVQTVNGKSGMVTLAASDVGAVPTTAEGAANGVAPLDAGSKLPLVNLPTPSVYWLNRDANGINTTIQLKRHDGTLAELSVLSNPDAHGNYLTRTETFYSTDGTTVLATNVYTLGYDANSDLISEVLQ